MLTLAPPGATGVVMVVFVPAVLVVVVTCNVVVSVVV